MNYLLDTNIVSEVVKPRPNPHVIRWLAEADEDRVHLSAVTFAEIRQGIEDLPPGPRRDALEYWIRHDLRRRFENRIVGIGADIAEVCGALLARSRRLGWNLNVFDALLAATARALSYTLVTRNTRHFEKVGLDLVDPWHG